MDDPRILRIITVGLVLAILAVIYFMLTGGFAVNKSKISQPQGNQANKAIESPKPTATPIVAMTPKPQASATSAYAIIANRAQGNTQTLPNTGFPIGLAVVISASAVGTGFALRKFPR